MGVVHLYTSGGALTYAGALPGFPQGQPLVGWDGAGNRAWFAQALWQALDSYFR
jgi:hypothetical protein